MNNKVVKIIIKILILLVTCLNMLKISYATEQIRIIGDVNEDGIIDTRDNLIVLRHVAASTISTISQKHPEWILKSTRYKLADISQDGIIDTRDTFIMLRHIAATTIQEIGKKHPEWKKYIEYKDSNEQNPVESGNNTVNIPATQIAPSAITLNQKDCTIVVGSNLELRATITPSDATNKTITWTSSDSKIATVSKSGAVHGVKAGKVTITAKTSNNKQATCIIRVCIPAKSISINKSNVTISKGSTEKLTVNFDPSNTSSKEIKWESLNSKIATVDNNGVITAKAIGSTTIRATSVYGKKATCKVDVIEKISKIKTAISQIKLSKSTNAQQGCEIYNNRLFMFSTGGKCNVYDLKTNKYLSTFTLPNAKNKFPHCNAVTFSKTFFKKTDKYPLLYINAYHDEGVQDGVCYVYRLIAGNGEKFSCELKQTIKIGFVKTELWKNSKDTGRTYGNFVIDTDNKFMYVYNLRESEDKTRFFKFKIPAVTATGAKTVTINQKDIVEKFDCKLFEYPQDSCYYKGNLYIISGINENHLWRVNVKTKNICELTIPNKPKRLKYFESESIAIYNGSAIASFTDYGSTYTYKIGL